MRVRSNIEITKKRRLHGGYFAMTAIFLASSILGGLSAIINVNAEEDIHDSAVTGTLIPNALRISKDGKPSIFEPTNIVITGATLLPFSRLEPLYAHLKNAPFKIRDIQGVMRQIARLYKQEGFYGVEIQLDLEQLENEIVAINIVEPADLKGDIIAQSKGRELKTPKLPMVKVKPKKVEKPKKKKVTSPREPVIKKAMKALKEPAKTKLEKRIIPDNKSAKEVKKKIYLLPEKPVVHKKKKPNIKGKIKLLDEKVPALIPAPKVPDMIQENVDPPPPKEDITLPNNDDMSVYTPSGIDDKKKYRPKKKIVSIRSYTSTGNPKRPVQQRETLNNKANNTKDIIATKPKEVTSQPIYTRVSFIDDSVQDRHDIIFKERPEDELLILEMQVNNKVRSLGILSYLSDDALLIPLFSFVEAMGFPIDVKPGAGLARGWFINEGNTFQLSTADDDIIIAGNQLEYPAEQIEVHMDDIYVSRRVLEQWFGLRISMNMSTLRLAVNIDSKLPYEDLMARRDVWERVADSRKGTHQLDVKVPFQDIPYKLATLPSAKVTSNYSYNKTSDGDSSESISGSMQVEGDLLYMSGNISANFRKLQDDSFEVNNINLSLKRLDDDGNLPLGATKIDAGDIFISSLPLVGSAASGRGISFVRKPKGYVSSPDDFIINGLAPIGWDVELYLNQSLIDFQTVDETGEYIFSSLPLTKGHNVLKVITYGVDGEKREKTEHFYVGPGLLSNGDFAYELSAIESSQKTLPFADISDTEDKRPSFLLSGEYGVNKDLSVVGGVYHGPLLDDTEPESAISAGIRYSLFKNIYLTTDFSSQSMGGESGSIETQWIRDNKVVSAGTTRNWSFLQSEKDALNSSFIKWDHTIYPPIINSINYGIAYTKNTFINAPTSNKISTKVSTNLFGVALNNQLDSEKIAGTDEANLRGTFTATKSLLGAQTRGRATYDLKDENTLESITLTSQKSMNQNTTVKGSFNKTFGDTSIISGSAEMRVKLDKLTVGISAGANEQGDLNAGISLSSNVLPVIGNDGGITYETSGDKSGFNVARLNIRSFLDKDGDKVYSDGDELLKDIRLNDERRGNSSITNNKGIATLKNLVPFTLTNISVDVVSLPDIYYVPLFPRIQVNPRPGLSGLIDFPITVEGELTGTVYINSNFIHKSGSERALVEVMDMEGNKIQKIYAERDGFFIIGGIPVGKYLVRVMPTHHLTPLTPAIPIEITFNEPVVDGLEFYAQTTNIDVYE